MKLLDTKLAQGDQDVILVNLYRAAQGEKLKVRIRSNAYEAQCSASCSIWSPEKRAWNSLVSIEPSLMATESKLCYQPKKAGAGAFEADVKELLRMAALVL